MANNETEVRVLVRTETEVDRYSMDQSGKSVWAPNGSPIRGEKIAFDDPMVPEVLFHVSPWAKKIEAMGLILAGGAGGLGGDSRDQIVSLTTDAGVAMQLAEDMRLLVRAAKATEGDEPSVSFNKVIHRWEGGETRLAWARPMISVFVEQAKAEGWGFEPPPSDLYGLSDYQTAFFVQRESQTRVANPLFFGVKVEDWKALEEDQVGVVAVDRDNLNTGALVTNFDIGKGYGLAEVRFYGDVPCGRLLQVPGLLYHHAGRWNRESILSLGLLTSFDQTGDDERVGAVFLTDTAQPGANIDVWGVETKGLAIEADPEDNEPAGEEWFACYEDISPHRLQLINEPKVELVTGQRMAKTL